MKTIYEWLMIVFLVLVVLAGMSEVFTQAGSLGNLDEESINMIALYDERLNTLSYNLSKNYNASKNKTSYAPDSNLVGDEFKEYFEHKSRIQQTYDMLKMVYVLPDILFLSIPFVDYEDTALYRTLAWFIVFLSLLIAVIVAIRKGKMTEEDG